MSGTGEERRRAYRVRVGRSLAALTGGLVRGLEAPTQVISLPSTEQITQRHARAVIDLCLRVGEAMLATGASSADVVATVLRLGELYDVTGMHIDITFTSIIVSLHRGVYEDPITVMRVVKVRTTDYTRLQAVYLLIDEITGAEEPPDVDAARRQLGLILTRPHPYRRWMVAFGKAVLAAGVVVMFDGGIVTVLVAAATAWAADLLTRRLSRWGLSAFFAQVAAAAITTAVASAMYWLRSVGVDLPGSNDPTVIVISGIIMLLSGIGLTSSALDAIDGYYVTASARGLEVIMLTLGLAVGISVTLGIALGIGIPIHVGTSLGGRGSLAGGVIGSALIGIGFALTSYVQLHIAPLMAAAAGVVFALYYVLVPFVPQPGLAPGIAGVAAGVIGYLVYRWLKVPESAMTMAGVIGLIPGLAVYRALYAIMDSEYDVTDALPAMVVAIATGLGLAAGTTVGGFLTRRAFGIDRAMRIATARRTHGLR